MMIRPILLREKKKKIDCKCNPHEEESAYNIACDKLAVGSLVINDNDEEDIEALVARDVDVKKIPARFLLQFRERVRHCYSHHRCQIKPFSPNFLLLIQQVISLSFYIFTWVVNGELLQGIANGKLCPGNQKYDKPATLTWISYNYMILSGILVVYPYTIFYRKNKQMNHMNEHKMTLSFYITRVWAGRIGWKNAVLVCAVISYMLLVLNFLYIVGLECVSVSLANAIYQLQTPFTVALSVCILKDKFVMSEAVGVVLSLGGVALIVVPPLAGGVIDGNGNNEQCSLFQHQEWSSPTLIGILATLCSAAIGSAYLLSWRIFSEAKSHDHKYSSLTGATRDNYPLIPSRLEGFVDTHMTLAMIGVCNLLLGWPFLILMDRLGLEVLEMPPLIEMAKNVTPLSASTSHDSNYDFQYFYDWGLLLNANGLVEYAFDASCAVAIYMTSPVATSVIAPLTIPLSLVIDRLLYGVDGTGRISLAQLPVEPYNSGGKHWSILTVIGVAVILAGVVLLEVKPDLSKIYSFHYSQKRS